MSDGIPEQVVLINDVQRSNIKNSNKPLVCQFIQDGYKKLQEVGAFKSTDEKNKEASKAADKLKKEAEKAAKKEAKEKEEADKRAKKAREDREKAAKKAAEDAKKEIEENKK